MGVRFSITGSTQRTQNFLRKMQNPNLYSNLDRVAQAGVAALRGATPQESGLTAMSWDYEIEVDREKARISWINTNRNNGVNIAIILQYGHGTGTGGYVAGRDYINPAIRPLFDQLADEVWKKVTSA